MTIEEMMPLIRSPTLEKNDTGRLFPVVFEHSGLPTPLVQLSD